MKKAIAFVTALCITAGALPAVQNEYNTNVVVYAEDGFTFVKNSETIINDNIVYMKDKDGFIVLAFRLYDDHAEVIPGVNIKYTHIDIPSNVEGVPVTKINGNAFGNYYTLESVTIPDTVEYIGNSAFSHCSRLTSIEIPDSVKEIGESAFDYDVNLKSIKLSNSLETIGKDAFYKCESLKKIKLPSSLKTISDSAFGLSGLESISLPDSLENIGLYPFMGCQNLKNVELPSTLTYIPEMMFQSCPGLEEFAVPPTVTTIGYSAFCNCENLRSIEIPDSVITIEDYAFADCKSLTSVKIPSNVVKIGDKAFYRCESLKSVNIQDNVGTTIGNNVGTTIGNNAFDSCKALETIEIPPNVVSLGKQAFSRCEALRNVKFIKKVTFAKNDVYETPSKITNIEEGAFEFCTNLESINIPPKAEEIGTAAFRNCSSLNTVILPNSVSKIGTEAFENCSNLKSLIIMNKDCVIGEKKEGYDNSRTICSKYDSTEKTASFNGTINGSTGSTTEQYATENSYAFDKINFEWKNNNWDFTNSPDYFGDERFINIDSNHNSNDINKILNGLSNKEIIGGAELEDLTDEKGNTRTNTEFNRLKTKIEKAWTGSCYGMSVTSILSCYGILRPIKNGAYTTLNELVSFDTKPIPNDIQTLINYYHLLQYTDYFEQHKAHAKDTNNKEMLDTIIDCLEDGSPTLVAYSGIFTHSNGEESKGGHAVVAYSYEEGKYIQNEKEYAGKIKIYDPNYYLNSEFSIFDYYMYYNSDKSAWAIPAHGLDSEKDESNKIEFVIDDIETINYHGTINNSYCISDFQFFFPIMQSDEMFSKDKSEIKTGSYINRKWNTIATANNYIELTNYNVSDVTSNDFTYAMDDPDSGYIVELKQPEQLDLMLSYENTLLHAEASNGTEARFDPSGCVSVCGENTDYELNIVLNDGYTVTDDWYGMSVRGSGVNEATLEKAENGYILNAENLKDVYIKAYNDEVADEVVISTEYPEVLIYEKDADTIGAAVDTDNDGTYETEIETQKAEYGSPTTPPSPDSSEPTDTPTDTPSPTPTSEPSEESVYGDINDDGVVNTADLIALIKEIITPPSEKNQNSDLNNDGNIDAIDLVLLKKMLSA